jgi:orotate phosphoribosyltransferase
MTQRATPSKQQFVELMIKQGVLRFGDFTLKSGRRSPYFFNLGAICTGSAISALGAAYADRLLAEGVDFEVVFGPAYKGIPIAVATAEALSARGRDAGWAFNRKEVKSHGEGGRFVGAELSARVVLVDDVLTAGTALREAADQVRAAGASLVAVVIAMDRQERVDGHRTAVAALAEDLAVPVFSIVSLSDVIQYLDSKGPAANHAPSVLADVKRYQQTHCVL